MILIIGGAYQGKLQYVKEKYKVSDDEIFECSSEAEIDLSKRVFHHFEYYLKHCLDCGKSPVLDFDDDLVGEFGIAYDFNGGRFFVSDVFGVVEYAGRAPHEGY